MVSKKVKELTNYRERRFNELNNQYIKEFNAKFGTSYTLKDFYDKKATQEFFNRIMSYNSIKGIQFSLFGNRVEYKLVSDGGSRLSKFRTKIVKEMLISYGDKNPFRNTNDVELGKLSIVVSPTVKAGVDYTHILRNKKLHLVQNPDLSLSLFSELSEHCFYSWKDNTTTATITGVIATYYNIFVSASADRQGIYHYSILETATMADLYEKASNGAYSIALKQLEIDKEIDKVMKGLSTEQVEERLIKIAGYLANMDTHSTNFGEVESFAILTKTKTCSGKFSGKFTNSIADITDDQINLMKLGSSSEEILNLAEKAEREVLDGNALMNAFQLCFLIWKKFHVLVLPSFFIGKMIQFRPVTVKSAAYVVTPDIMKAVTDNCTAKYGKAFKIIGDDPLFITDMNGCKLEFDFSQSFDLEILKIAKNSISGANSHFLRILDTICEYVDTHNLEDDNMLDFLYKELLPNIFREQLNNIKKSFFNADPKESITAELIDGYIGELVKISSIANSDINSLKTARKQFLNRLAKDLNKLNLSEGIIINRKLVPDWSFLITGNDGDATLKFGEAFTTEDVENRGVMYKWPATGNLERYNYENNIPEIINPLIKDFFFLCDQTSLILPNSTTLMKMLAGLDFDMDTAACCKDRQEGEESNLTTLACMVNELSRLVPIFCTWRNEK